MQLTSTQLPQYSAMPQVFIPHGAGPCFFMDWQPPQESQALEQYLTEFNQRLPSQPKALLVISAHWLEEEFTILTKPQPDLLFDYYGFPESTYQLQYPAPTDTELAQSIVQQLGQAGIIARTNSERDFDHGVFIPLLLMFPEAQIPIVQISLRKDLDPQAHLELGAALAGLAQQQVLIIGSGMSFHNMRGYRDPRFTAPSQVFDEWLSQTLVLPASERNQALKNWSQAPAARECHPQGAEEHLLPLMVVAGAATGAAVKGFSQLQLQTQISAFEFLAK